MLSYAQGISAFKWTLPDVPKIRFYWLLHTYFQKQGLTHDQMGKVYRAIDPRLLHSTSSNRIICRKISRIIQNHHNHDNLVEYPNSKTTSQPVAAQDPKDSHYRKRNVVRREQRTKQKLQQLRNKAITATKAAQKASQESEQLHCCTNRNHCIITPGTSSK